MSRLVATMRCDVRLQVRNGFYLAVAFLLAVLAAVVSQLPHLDWDAVVAPLLLGNLSLATFMFMAGLVLLEKDEGTLQAQIVTPLRPGEYLTSKTVSLTALSTAENLTVAWLVCGFDLHLAPLVAGLVLASAIYCLAGFIAVVRYDSINEYLLPSILYVTALSLPILHYAGLMPTPLMYLHPLQGPLVLLSGAVEPLAAWQWLYGLASSTSWIAIAWYVCQRRYHVFVVREVGGR